MPEYTVRFKTIWLATPKAFYQKRTNNDLPVVEFRSWRMPINLAWRMLREGYAMQEETAAAWALDNCPEGCILRGVSREHIHTFDRRADVEDVMKYTKAVPIRDVMKTISEKAMHTKLSNRKKGGSGCREFIDYSKWVDRATVGVR